VFSSDPAKFPDASSTTLVVSHALARRLLA